MDAAASDTETPRLESHPGAEGAPGQGEGAEGAGRRRRRRGGRGGERGGERGERGERIERGDRPERTPHESVASDNQSPADNIGNRAPQQEASHHESEFERTGEKPAMYDPRNDPEERAAEPQAEPRHVYTQAAAPVAFKAVIQHDESEEEAHRPQRKRRHGSDESNEPQPLQLVETQAEAAPLPVEDELPRRSKPRRRRSGPVESEPLKLVETQPNSDAQRGESSPTP